MMGGFDPDQPRGPDGRWIELAALLRKAGGFTHVMDSGETNPKKGIAVGVPTPHGGADWATFDAGTVRPSDVKRFAEEYADALKTPGRAIGGWANRDPNDGEVRDALDVVEVVQSMERAYALAQAAGQDGVYDFEKGFISTEDLGKRINKEISMSTVQTPVCSGEYDFAKGKDGKLAFWKQILPKKTVHYTAKDGSRQRVDFDDEFLTDLATSTAVDKIGFLLADKDNAHTMDPERWRGEVEQMEVREDGLYGKIVFPNPDAAKAVLDNPDLGVSARIKQNIERSDGSTIRRGLIHVLGTLDPQVSGMSGWQTADLSHEGEVIDLSEETYEDMTTKKSLTDFTVDDVEKMTDEELDEFLREYVPEISGYDGEQPKNENTEGAKTKDETETHEETPVPETKEKELAGAGADLSNDQTEAIELANAAVASANARADEAMRRVAEAEWREERAALLGAGVPPAALDLAEPVLNRADDMVIDLSHTDEDDVNVSGVIRSLLDGMKGTVDLSAEEGHNGHFNREDGEDPDAEALALWDSQF